MTDTLVCITGASRGIGAALAESMPFADARIIDISRSGGAEGTEHLAADLADPSAWSEIETRLCAELRGFDGARAILVHNAGTIDPVGPAGQVDSGAYRRNALLNAAAPIALGHAFLRAVTDFGGEAHLLQLTSGAATSPYEGWTGYCAGKAALEMWVRAAGLEQQRRREEGAPWCRIVAVAPGVVATAMQERIRASDPQDFPAVEKFHELHRSGRLTDPHEAAVGIWGLLDHDLETGAVVDLRSLDIAR